MHNTIEKYKICTYVFWGFYKIGELYYGFKKLDKM